MARILGSLAVGDRVVVPVEASGREWLGERIVWTVAAKNHTGYPSDSVTLITDQIIYMAFDAKEPKSTQIERQSGGNNRYALSNIHQWMNSNAAAGMWYAPQHNADEPPIEGYVTANPYASRSGFMHMLPVSFTRALLETSLTIPANVTDGSPQETINTRMFLPSSCEVGIANTTDSARYALFVDNTHRIRPMTWYTRTPPQQTQPSRTIVCVSTVGAETQANANTGSNAARPVCNLSARVPVSDTQDGDGYYTYIGNRAPVISGTDGDLGVARGIVRYDYTVTDEDGDAVTVTIKIDSKTVREHAAVLGDETRVTIDGDVFGALVTGEHTLTIHASDGITETVRTMTFTKYCDRFEIALAAPLPAVVQPTRANIRIYREIPAGATMLVEACNNPYDDAPVWEDATRAVEQSTAYVFANREQAAEASGYSMRVAVERGAAIGPCWVAGIGGGFA